ncbi:shikimate dehydrogenase [Actinoplanes xinjiangensis]|uniref:Shikimate dehydrogenase (NADP(+)) n=1 Tax=Actinoplanes xinjiangensis TaxID=512350 RepID=A0A316F7B9_9ACTN|nr:shikimate dehydrogenase [Actinoplanes xinjiangensis]PWK40497.1 shikimate dehydrogenase [Actinoplanes xinjiangensis]GIF42283.1 shikimate dehydrogenase (NADP(+)) [Actinoplanes xinjiangensis]
MTSPQRAQVLVGLIGAGIGSSHSPLLHQAEADRQGIRLLYTIIDSDASGLTADDLPGLLRWARTLGYRGLNVTYPFKQQIVRHLDHLSAEARTLGAVNTVVFADGGACGHNTDVVGFARNFRRNFPTQPTDTVVQLGAGGAGSAVAHAMLTLGAGRLTLVDVDEARAHRLAGLLAAQFGTDRIAVGAHADLTGLLAGADGLINTTPIGMAHHPGSPVAPESLRTDLWVADIVYRPTDTALLRAARATGAATLHGAGMSVYQAVAAFEHFTGVPADAEAMLADSAELLRRGR